MSRPRRLGVLAAVLVVGAVVVLLTRSSGPLTQADAMENVVNTIDGGPPWETVLDSQAVAGYLSFQKSGNGNDAGGGCAFVNATNADQGFACYLQTSEASGGKEVDFYESAEGKVQPISASQYNHFVLPAPPAATSAPAQSSTATSSASRPVSCPALVRFADGSAGPLDCIVAGQVVDNPAAVRYYTRWLAPLLALGRNATPTQVTSAIRAETNTTNTLTCDSYMLAANALGWRFSPSLVGHALGFPGLCYGTLAADANATEGMTGLGFRSCEPHVLANQNTSCGFARNVFTAYVAAYRAGPAHLPTSVTASSPVTRSAYTMTCYLGGDEAVTCSGGNHAQVVFDYLSADRAAFDQ